MPPKVKVTKEEIINAAVNIVRSSGAQAINARTIASVLNCSTQPVFSNFATMDELRLAVVERADILCQEYMQREVNSGEFPAYKANGMAYIRFAKEEKELFKFLYMRDRSSELIPETTEQTDKMESIVHNNTGLSGAEAKLFHLEMWAYVHGIATMFATGFLDLDWELVSRMLTDSYQGLRKQYGMEGSRMDAIRIDNLTKKYKDVVAVNMLNLSVHRGELLSLLGVNGAGKTTTMKMLSCLTQPTSGDAFINGKSICKDTAAVKSLIAISPQETAVAPGLSVWENLELMCGVHGFTKEKQKAKIAELTELLGLEAVIKKKAGKLSGGWQRRLSIAMALISEPEILFLDEPTLGLDVLARSDLWDLIRSLKGKVTIILTTHYMEEAESLSDRIAIMKDGKLLICDTADKIKERAGTDNFEQAFIRIVKGVAK